MFMTQGMRVATHLILYTERERPSEGKEKNGHERDRRRAIDSIWGKTISSPSKKVQRWEYWILDK